MIALYSFPESGIEVLDGDSTAAIVLEGLLVLEHGVGGPGPYVELHGIAVWLPGSAGEHEKVRDADVGGEGLDEVVGAVPQADQAYMKGHGRSTPGRPLGLASAGCAASAGPRDTTVSPARGVGVLV